MTLLEIYGLVAHLVQWGKARVIDTINKHTTFQVHPKADFASSAVARRFNQRFGGDGSGVGGEGTGGMDGSATFDAGKLWALAHKHNNARRGGGARGA